MESIVRIVVVGRGNVGGGLARLWAKAGHEVTLLGKEGGDASDADVVVIAVPGGMVADAMSRIIGAKGKTTIDATNSFTGPNDGFASLAEETKSILGGPTIKAFNTNFALLYDQVAAERIKPHSVFACDPEARDTAERLVGDTGYEPIHVGELDKASVLEAQIQFTMMMAQGEMGPYFYRFSRSGEL
jgi:8-hydroxy-5-deazaflavin:NADPH oxidoreductase